MNNQTKLMVGALALMMAVSPADAARKSRKAKPAHPRPDHHAPISVKHDHNHTRNEVMFSAKYMYMKKGQLQNGTALVSNATVLGSYAAAPTGMTTDTIMLGAMYAPAEQLTLMAGLPYHRKAMDHTTAATTFRTHSQGIGDLSIAGIFEVEKSKSRQILLTAGFTLPTGSIDETRAVTGAQLPYGMQLGSGTVDFTPSITLTEKRRDWSWGSQANLVYRIGQNQRGYSLGDRFGATTWISKVFTEAFSGSLRAQYTNWGNVDGLDSGLAVMAPSAEAKAQAGQRIDIGIGANFAFNHGWLKHSRLAAEYLIPVYQYLDGPQLRTESVVTVGWQRNI